MTGFSVVLRGYQKRQVDELIARVEGTLGRAPMHGKPITFKEFGWTEFEVTMRGYDRFEVDGIMRSYRRELAALEGVELTDDTGPSNSLAIVLGDPAPEDHSDDDWIPQEPVPDTFPVRLRGYDRAQVSSLISRALGTLGHRPLQGAPVTREELNNPRFNVIFSGYDRREVDQAIGRYLKELLDQADPEPVTAEPTATATAPEVTTDPDPEPQPNPEAEAKPEPEPVAEKAETPEAEPEPEPVTAEAPELEVEPVTAEAPEVEPEAKAEPEPEVEAEPEPPASEVEAPRLDGADKVTEGATRD